MKKFLAMALALLMVAVLLPVTAMAEGAALPEAVDGKITLTDNVTLASPHNITTDTVLDLGGKTLTGSLNIRNGANVTIKNGTITCPGGQALNVLGTNTGSKTTVTLESTVTITNTTYGVCIFGENNDATGNSVVNLNGCKISVSAAAESACVFVSGNLKQATGTEVNINGAELINTVDLGVVVNGKATTNINNATIEGHTALYIKAGAVNIANSTITAKGEYSAPVANGSGANSTGDAIVMDSKQGYAGDMKLNIAGGNTITSESGYALQVANTDVATGETKVVDLTISGSTLKGSPNKGAVVLSEGFIAKANGENTGVTASVTGGTFNGDTTVLENYLADGKVIRNGKVVNKTITIIVPDDSTDTTTTTEKPANPATGANDFVGAAAALAVMSLLGMAVASRKK